MDNARIHHGDEIAELADQFGTNFELEMTQMHKTVTVLTDCSGIRIEYLPPYSPDLNPIEEAFSKIKHFLRRHQDYYLATTDDGILFDMYEVMEIITPEDAEGYYRHAGYF
jgi:transposase